MQRSVCAIIGLIILIACLAVPGLRAEDYQYQYFKGKKKHTPFSDYIPRVRLHYRTVPHYLEDYYELYGLKEYYNENTLRRNIERLKTALRCKFRHPSQALVRVESEPEYRKYRILMFMHINILIMRDYLKIAARYDKMRIKFSDRDFAAEISDSLKIARGMYQDALPYWDEARKYARQASEIKITTDLGFMESERFSIVKGSLDYGKIINGYMARVDKNQRRIEQELAKR